MAERDTLAGSTLTMDKAVKNMVRFGALLPDAVRATTLVPARVLGLKYRKGSHEIGKVVDLVLLDMNLNVKEVLFWEAVYQDERPFEGGEVEK